MYKLKKKTFNNILQVIARAGWTKQKWCNDVSTADNAAIVSCGGVAYIFQFLEQTKENPTKIRRKLYTHRMTL